MPTGPFTEKQLIAMGELVIAELFLAAQQFKVAGKFTSDKEREKTHLHLSLLSVINKAAGRNFVSELLTAVDKDGDGSFQNFRTAAGL